MAIDHAKMSEVCACLQNRANACLNARMQVFWAVEDVLHHHVSFHRHYSVIHAEFASAKVKVVVSVGWVYPFSGEATEMLVLALHLYPDSCKYVFLVFCVYLCVLLTFLHRYNVIACPVQKNQDGTTTVLPQLIGPTDGLYINRIMGKGREMMTYEHKQVLTFVNSFTGQRKKFYGGIGCVLVVCVCVRFRAKPNVFCRILLNWIDKVGKIGEDNDLDEITTIALKMASAMGLDEERANFLCAGLEEVEEEIKIGEDIYVTSSSRPFAQKNPFSRKCTSFRNVFSCV